MESPTREAFAYLAAWEVALFYALAALSLAVFGLGLVLAVLKYRSGQHDQESFVEVRRRALRGLGVVLSHVWIGRRDRLAGWAHAAIFYGFLALLAGSLILALNDDVTQRLFGYDFWRGDFYLGFSLIMDISGALLVLGLLIMAARRLSRPFCYDYTRPDRSEGEYRRRGYVVEDWVFLAMLLILAASGFALEGLRIAELNPPFETWAPIGWLLGQALREAGVEATLAAGVGKAVWWLHALAAFAFVSMIPFTKAVHMLMSPMSTALRRDEAGRSLPGVPDHLQEVGFGRISDLSPRYLLQLDACTRCGRCHAVCPATASGYPLSPREVILDLREFAEGSAGSRGRLRLAPRYDIQQSFLGDPLRYETLWSCMQCLACVQVCPVGIEHAPLITQFRRRLLDIGEIDPLLQSVLEKVHQSGNSFGEPRRKRARWTKTLDFEMKDIRKEAAEVLWFVGDYASFDLRNQKITAALARVLRHAGADVGLLYEAEQNAGNDVRRVGEEGLFVHLRQVNAEVLSGCEFERIVTSDPHTYNALKNEYGRTGAGWNVVHHTEYLLELLRAGKIRPGAPLGYRVTYHDPCTLGRYNQVYEHARLLLRSLGCEVVEMPRNRDNSFCCGAGGGRLWMSELGKTGFPRPAEARIKEAAALGSIDCFVVSCPKDVVMFEDAIKTSGHEDEIELREVSELVLESLES